MGKGVGERGSSAFLFRRYGSRSALSALRIRAFGAGYVAYSLYARFFYHTILRGQKMLRFEDIQPGSYITGLVPDQKTLIRSVERIGNTLSIIGKNDDGSLIDSMIFETDLPHLALADKNLSWSFTADADDYRLYSEAYRIHLAWLFDPMIAVHTSSIEPLPHQITAVYDKMLSRQPLRYILADDPGAGKTIMTGLLLKELILRGDVKRCLIVSPGSLTEQWQEELSEKFNLKFKIFTNEDITASLGNVFDDMPFCIARLDKLARNEDIQKRLELSSWDLIVCDEAHKMSASWFSGDLKKTKRFQLGELLAKITRHFLLLTATPHNGKNDEFELFLSLVDSERYAQMKPAQRESLSTQNDYSDIMRRLVKEELVRFDGTPLFPERIAYTIPYDLSDAELELYEAVSEYVRTEFNRAEHVTGKKYNTVGFALTILQRRLASSPAAIYLSLSRRREKLEKKLQDISAGKDILERAKAISDEDWDDIDEMDAAESESNDEQLIDLSTAARSIEELKQEIETLKYLERMADKVRKSNCDKKWEELASLLTENEKMFEIQQGHRDRLKLIIFTEHRDTLNYLDNKIGAMIGANHVVTIHGGMGRDERHRMEAAFKHDPEIIVLIATDAAGEGINLQRAHLMINYDLPWNPNRLEQRFGRIHRIGQRDTCYLWNLVASNTREGEVFARLFEKLEIEREKLGGKVFDILGKVTFDNKPLRELLIEAIQYGESEEAKAHFSRVIDGAFDKEAIEALIHEHALTKDILDEMTVTRIREEMERIESRKLQPHFIGSFFLNALDKLGGKYRKRANNRWTLERVPQKIREENAQSSRVEAISKTYEYICFDTKDQVIENLPDAYLVCTGSALLDSVISVILKSGNQHFKEGTIYIDERNTAADTGILLYIETVMHNAILRNNLPEVIDRQVNYLLIDRDNHVKNAGYAPYLDFQTPKQEEREAILSYIKTQTWLTQDIEQNARKYAMEAFVQKRFEMIRTEREARYAKMASEIRKRLCSAINYWDAKANEYEEKSKHGVKNATLNAHQARDKADELRNRQSVRLKEIELEKQVHSKTPNIIGGAFVISRNLLNELMHVNVGPDNSKDTKAMEMIGMHTVMKLERQLGNTPIDVSADNVGYDIESHISNHDKSANYSLKFIEVKARQKDADYVTLTRNEILTARNCEERGNYILAIVMVDGEQTQTTYYHGIHFNDPDISMRSINYDIKQLGEMSRNVQNME